MKNLLLLATFGIAGLNVAADASTKNCEQTVSISVSQMLHADPTSSEIVHWVRLDKSYIDLSVWLVGSGTKEVIRDVPVSGSYWLVTTRQVDNTACIVEQIILDARF